MRFRRRGPGSAWWRAGGSEAPSPGLACGLVNRRIRTSLSKGTCVEALQAQRPVLEADLVGSGFRRWPGYAPAAYQRGPAQCSRSRCRLAQRASGVLDIYQNRSEPMPDLDIACASTFADIAMDIAMDMFLDMVLESQAEGSAGLVEADINRLLAPRLEVYQAEAVVMVDLRVSLTDAMALLRAHACTPRATAGGRGPGCGRRQAKAPAIVVASPCTQPHWVESN